MKVGIGQDSHRFDLITRIKSSCLEEWYWKATRRSKEQRCRCYTPLSYKCNFRSHLRKHPWQNQRWALPWKRHNRQ